MPGTPIPLASLSFPAGADTAKTPIPVSSLSFSGSAPKFPFDNPKYYYGEVLPLAKNLATGQISLAVPEMIRAPLRGLIGIEHRLDEPYQPRDLHAFSPDEEAAVLAMGGLRPSIAEAVPEVANPVRPVAAEARQAGYVLPPSSISEDPGIVAKVLAGWSGKIKTQQAASAANQAITNQLAAKALGLPPETTLTEEVLNGVRGAAGKAYQHVIDEVPQVAPDKEFKDAIGGLGGRNGHAAQAFPNITKNPGIEAMVTELQDANGPYPTGTWIELVKELRHGATENLKALGDPSKHALGLAQRQAADAIDDMVERRATADGKPDAVTAYKAARRLIAKSYDVQGVTNTATGDVNARGLGRLADKGRPLTDELRTIARAATAFPKAMQAPSGFGDNEPWSALDFFGSAAAAAHGNPSVAGAIMARPLARRLVLSEPVQNMVARPPVTPPPGALRMLVPSEPHQTLNALGAR